MKPFSTKLCYSKVLPVIWTLFTIILLCLPGSALPGTGIFIFKGLDKTIHFVLFGGIVLLWGLYVRRVFTPEQSRKKILLAMLFSISLGIAMEYVQLYFVADRSFDVGDILADTAGAITAFLILQRSSKIRNSTAGDRV